MALQAAAALLLTIIGVFACTAQSQDGSFQVFRGSDESQLAGFTPMERLAVAAKTGETQVVRLTGASQSAVVQEDVSLSLDCLPWLRRFPGGSITWTFVQLDEFGNLEDPTAAPQPLAPNANVMPPERIIVGGQFNRWLNITRTVIIQGAEDPDSKIFMCEVCIARGTPFEECHTTNYTSGVIGAPPMITQNSRNFCVSSDAMRRLQELDCDVPVDSPPTPIPNPQRTWMRNNNVVYTAELGAAPDASEFFMNNTILTPGTLDPQPFTVLSEGQIFFNYQVDNISAPGMIPDVMSIEAAERILFNLLLGTWTCSASNELGSDSVTYTIRECGATPQIPDCSASSQDGSMLTIFANSGEVLTPGCNVCVEEGSSITLDCTVSVGAPPISYNWTDSNGNTLSENARLVVSQPGDYNCAASNLDDVVTTEASVLFFSPRAELTTSIVGRTTNGCERLRNINETERASLLEGVDTCVFIGEMLQVQCASSDPDAMLELSMGVTMLENTSVSILVTEANMDQVSMTFSCRITNAMGPCGQFMFTKRVEVFDPARIIRVGDLPDMAFIGAGRPMEVVQRNNGSTVTLRCPTTGITEETTVWRRITENSEGCLVETELTDLPQEQQDRFAVTEEMTGGLDDLQLTITDLSFQDEGTYVCRTENVAGVDAGVVSLIIDEGTPVWEVSEFSDCNVNCRDGIRNRTVVCRNSRDRLILPNFMCGAITPRPSESESCSTLFPQPCFLDPVWLPRAWGLCTAGCKGGYRLRDVDCVIPMTGAVREDVECARLIKPRTTEFCTPTCCESGDDYSATWCSTPNRCGEILFQQFCCWTCSLKEKP